MLFVTDSPVVVGHPQLGERRKLVPSDLAAFGVVANVEGQHLSEGGVVPSALLQSHALDPRLERATSQQYVRMAVVRRDAKFEMCGVAGTLVLSGSELVGSTSPKAMRPIRIRLILWGLGLVAFLVIGVTTIGGRSELPYFARTNEYIAMLVSAGLIFSVPSLGIALRELRKGFKFSRFTTYEWALFTATALSLICALAVTKLARPQLVEAEAALAARNTARARMVLDALLATGNHETAVLETQDKIGLIEAAAQPLEAKLDLLDAIASGKRSKADQAAREARTARLQAVSSKLHASAPAAAITAINRWFPNGSDPDVSELRAQAEEQVFASCVDPACRWAAARRINAAAATPERAAQLAGSKRALQASLQFAEVPGEAVATRLARLGQLGHFGIAARGAAGDDTEIAEAASKAVTFAQDERRHVALVGAPQAAVAELLGPLTKKTDLISHVDAEGYQTFLTFDGQQRCRGVYVVGSQEKIRSISDGVATAALSQAVGRSATLKRAPATGTGTSRWVEGGIGVVARWSQRGLVELRVGDAAP